MRRPLVTIAIPTYNRAAFSLPQALRCTVAQTYRNLEILVADNGSTDDTESVVRSFDDPRIRYVRHPENMGAINNFNYCIREARGEYFLLFHDDDLIDPDLIETCVLAAHGHEPVGLVRTGTRLVDVRGAVLEEYPNRVGGLATTDFILGWFAGKTGMYLCSTLFNTEHLREVGGWKHSLFASPDTEMRVVACFGRVDVPDVKASFRMHGNVMYPEAQMEQWCADSLDLLDTLRGLVPPDDRARVWNLGRRYFCDKMYLYASRLTSPVERLRTYWRIFGRFGHSYSPLHFVYSRHATPLVNAVRRRVGRLALSPWRMGRSAVDAMRVRGREGGVSPSRR